MAGQLDADNPSLAAVRTGGKIQAGERPQHVLPGFGSTRGVNAPGQGVQQWLLGLGG